MVQDIVFMIISFLIGGIPFGKIIAGIKGIDITKEGSGNIGATNVFRTVGKVWGVIVLILDALKGAIPTFVSMVVWQKNVISFYLPEIYVFVGISAILGHIFSPFMGFKGGKGVATSLGVFLVLTPTGTLVGAIVFLVFVLVFRIVSISSIAASVAVFSYLLVSSILKGNIGSNYILISSTFVVMLFIIIRHIPNIKRIIKGEEKKIL